MDNGALDRLLEAESNAEERVERAKKRANQIVARANREAQERKEMAIDAFEKGREEKLERAKGSAGLKAREIEEGGVKKAEHLRDDLETRIPGTVEKLIGRYFD